MAIQMASSSLGQASSLVREGISIFAGADGHSDRSEAIRTLRTALVSMQSLLRGVPQNYLLFSSVNAEGEGDCQQFAMDLVEIPDLYDETNYYIHKHALLLSEDATRSWQEHDALAFSCATVLFNIALVFHQEGRRSANRRTLRKALNIYEKALDIVVCEQEIVCSKTFAFLVLATMNNISCIYRHIGMIQNAVNTHERLVLFAAHVRQAGTSWPLEVSEIIQKFIHNRSIDTRAPSCQAARSA